MFILRLQDGSTILHTGDFRFTSEMLLNPFLSSLPVDRLYIDSTYLDPKYNFPRQRDTISQVVSVVKEHLELKPQTLILCGAYCIGKLNVDPHPRLYCSPINSCLLSFHALFS